MTQVSYDVLIIGGGPGGSCAAAFARQKNLRTLVLEKSAFPRFRIGESLLPMGNQVFRETGVWEKIRSAGFMPKFGAEFHKSDGSSTKHVLFSNGLIPGLESTFQVDRAKFDALLLDHARELGAEVRMETSVTSIATSAESNRVTFRDASGEHTVEVPYVIDSTGRETNLTTELKRELDVSPFPKRMAIYSHFHGIPRVEGRERGNIHVVRIDHGWFWIIPLDQERTSVGLVSTVEAFRESQKSPEQYFDRAVAGSSKLRQLLGSPTATMPFRVTTDYSYFRRDLAGPRVVLVGDAAGFFDPIFSSGVYMACSTAKDAVRRMAKAHAAQRPLTGKEQRDYTREVKSSASVFQRLITAFYDDDSFEVFMCQQIPWGLSRGLTSIVAGHSKLTWPLWWRFKIFLLVCRLQKHLTLVKPEHVRTTAVPLEA